eukprot:SAG31_NODE_29699_length_391_cov_0.818493_1_plen_63_part_10
MQQVYLNLVASARGRPPGRWGLAVRYRVPAGCVHHPAVPGGCTRRTAVPAALYQLYLNLGTKF